MIVVHDFVCAGRIPMTSVILAKDFAYFTCNTYYIEVDCDYKQEFYTSTVARKSQPPGAELQVLYFSLEHLKELIKIYLKFSKRTKP